ncbi:glycosyltransferase [Microbacterium sp. zg.Y1090]|uniref:glycosyltransferase n=1 Tax=Microbacterium TaxID=33882 RepID=UPI00214BE770|nr:MULTISPECIES: glycosyltransferase [unclassified Microbacterium]MCR2813183.1 glycosyltransferase [Microbacterium sp. zg.Y1084]MCR2819496.1 glycosyltransferase [Microbacterium sp. zg.Y1090]MDL5487350.1 glycosyltransferase [Microbacterium sp. zg-Y1211]WIM28469.1 glycosyltransferase [Microbacterium sp. zg-Y1090]
MTSPATPEPAKPAVRRPLTILIGCDTFAPDVNGAARFAERLAAGLAARGHDVHVVAPGRKYKRVPAATEVIEGVPLTVHRLPSVRWPPHDWLRFVWPWRSKHYARKVLSEVRPDVVHIQSHIVIGRGLARIATQRGIPVIATNHVMAENILDFTTLPPLLDKVMLKAAWDDAARTFALARAVTTPTRRAADFLESTIDVSGVIPISCGIDASNYTPHLAPRENNRILFVGRLTSEKHLDTLLHAVTKLDPALDVTVDIVGGGDQRKALDALTAQLGLTDRVRFHGRVDEDELRSLYTRASVFAMPSIAELQSIATMEAMASGLPVVAADALALPHLVQDGVNGWLFRPRDADDLALKLTRVLTAGPEEHLAMQKASLKGVEIHDIARTLDTFEALYRGEPVEP